MPITIDDIWCREISIERGSVAPESSPHVDRIKDIEWHVEERPCPLAVRQTGSEAHLPGMDRTVTERREIRDTR